MLNKVPHIARFFLGLIPILSLLLSACTATGAGTVTVSPATPGSSPTSASTSETSTPAITPSANTTAPTPLSPLQGIRMLDSRNGWALSASSILKTSDGGQHWQNVTPANAGLSQNVRGQFLNTKDAWIAIGPANQQEGPGIAFLHTTDGGVSWQRSHINDSQAARLDVPHFITTQQGWLAVSGTPGAGSAATDIWSSSDGGQNWTKRSSNKDASGLNLGYVTGISFRDGLVGMATGNRGAGGDNTVPSIALTFNGGQSWQTKTLPHLLGGYVDLLATSQPPVFFGNLVLLPVTFTGADGPLLVLYRSNDSGLTWSQTSVVHIQADNTYVVDASHAWATDTRSGQLYSTSDGGNHWAPTSATAYHLQALSFIDSQHGWGVTSDQLLQTSDSGKTWQRISSTVYTV